MDASWGRGEMQPIAAGTRGRGGVASTENGGERSRASGIGGVIGMGVPGRRWGMELFAAWRFGRDRV